MTMRTRESEQKIKVREEEGSLKMDKEKNKKLDKKKDEKFHKRDEKFHRAGGMKSSTRRMRS